MFSFTNNPISQTYGVIKETVTTTIVNALIINEPLVQMVQQVLKNTIIAEEDADYYINSIDFIVICYALDAYDIEKDCPSHVKTLLATNINTTFFGSCTIKETIAQIVLPYMLPCAKICNPDTDYIQTAVHRDVINGKLILDS